MNKIKFYILINFILLSFLSIGYCETIYTIDINNKEGATLSYETDIPTIELNETTPEGAAQTNSVYILNKETFEKSKDNIKKESNNFDVEYIEKEKSASLKFTNSYDNLKNIIFPVGISSLDKQPVWIVNNFISKNYSFSLKFNPREVEEYLETIFQYKTALNKLNEDTNKKQEDQTYKLIVKLPAQASNTNADEKDDQTNTYTWNLRNNTLSRIEIEYSTKKKDNLVSGIISLVVLIGFMIFSFLYKR